MPESPRRRLHPLLFVLTGLAVGILAGDCLLSAGHLSTAHLFAIGAVAAAPLLVACYMVRRRAGRRWRAPLVILLFLSIGLISAAWRQTTVDFPYHDRERTCLLTITQTPEPKRRTLLCRAQTAGEWVDSGFVALPRRTFLVYITHDSLSERLQRGDQLLVRTTLSKPRGSGIPDEWDYGRYLRHHGISGTAYVPSTAWRLCGHTERTTLRQRAIDLRRRVVRLYSRLGFSGDERAVLQALTVGDRSELSRDLADTYTQAGVRHLLAISGLHVGMVYAVLNLLLLGIGRRAPRLRRWLTVVGVAGLWGFALVCGLPVSAVRAVSMCTVYAAIGLLRREPATTGDALLATATLILLVDPFSLFDVGFQLSVAAVAGIILLLPRIHGLWQPRGWLADQVWMAIAVCLSAQIAVAPLTMYHFGQLPVHFLLATLVALPLVTVIMYTTGLMLVLTPVPVLQQPVADVLNLSLQGLNSWLRGIGQLPYGDLGHIYLTVVGAVLLYLIVGLLCLFADRRSAVRDLLVGVAVAAFVGLQVGQAFTTPKPCGVAFYNSAPSPAMVCAMPGRRPLLLTTDTTTNVAYYLSRLSPHFGRLRLSTPEVVRPPYDDGVLYADSLVALFAGRRVAFLSVPHLGRQQPTQPFAVDYLYVGPRYRGNLAEASRWFSPAHVVVDGDLWPSVRRRWQSACDSLGITCTLLGEMGFLVDW